MCAFCQYNNADSPESPMFVDKVSLLKLYSSLPLFILQEIEEILDSRKLSF